MKKSMPAKAAICGERWVLLSKLILFDEDSLRRALSEFVDHFHSERNHQGKSNVLLSPLMLQHAVCTIGRCWAENTSAVYSSATAAPNEFFDHSEKAWLSNRC